MGNTQQFELQGAVCPGEEFIRIEGQDLMINPHRSIVAISCKTDRGQPFVGSGLLLSKNLLLTAAHNIFYHKEQRPNTNFKIYHEPDGVAKFYYSVSSYKYLPMFQNKLKLDYDYGLMRVKEDQSRAINYNGFPKLLVTCQKCLQNSTQLKIGIYGYPLKHRDNFSLINQGGIRLYQYGFQLKGRVNSIDHKNFLMSYRINTKDGQSGCPIIMDGDVIGIHNGGRKQQNIGRLITPEMAENILRWSEQLGGDRIQIKYNRGCCKKQEPIMSAIISSENKTASVENNLDEKPMEPIKSLPLFLEVKTEDLKFKGDKDQSKKQEPKEEIKTQKSKEVYFIYRQQQKPSLNKKQEFPNVPIKPVPQPLVKEQRKAMQVRLQKLSQIVDKLKSIPAQEKQRIISLTLKQTVTILQKKCNNNNNLRCNKQLMKGIIIIMKDVINNQ